MTSGHLSNGLITLIGVLLVGHAACTISDADAPVFGLPCLGDGECGPGASCNNLVGICVPDGEPPRTCVPGDGTCDGFCFDGVCAPPCADNGDCDFDHSCQTLTNPKSLAPTPLQVCLSPAAKGEECFAAFDDDACADPNLECIAVEFDTTRDIVINRCFERCTSDSQCTDGLCLPGGRSQFGISDQIGFGAFNCDPEECPGGLRCICASNEVCTLQDSRFRCVAVTGTCATPVPVGGRCNRNDAVLCDTSPFEASEIQVHCVGDSLMTDGICIALCADPVVDVDGDGTLTDETVEPSIRCPEPMVCSSDLLRERGLFAKVVSDGSGRARRCDPSVCIPGHPCGHCGPGDGECALIDGEHICVGFGATCVDR